jgi:DNA-binding LacI/PurR family transcriptional regulator
MANIRDIARKSGYSVSTVSRFINESGYVSDTARQEIKQVIDKLDYVPNAIARDLSKGKTSTIGVVLPHTRHPFFTQLLHGVMDEAFAKGYNVLVLQSHYDEQLELEYLKRLHRKAFDALIFISHKLPLAKIYEYQKYGPVICCENPKQYPMAAAYVLREKTYIAAFAWMKQQGFQSIAILLSRSFQVSATSKMIYSAYQKVFSVVPDASLVHTNLYNYEDGYRIASQIIQTQPDFIFGNGDDIVAGIRQYYLDHHQEPPAMMGQENQISSGVMKIPTIDHHLKEVGVTACQLALSGEIKQIAIDSELIIR